MMDLLCKQNNKFLTQTFLPKENVELHINKNLNETLIREKDLLLLINKYFLFTVSPEV